MRNSEIEVAAYEKLVNVSYKNIFNEPFLDTLNQVLRKIMSYCSLKAKLYSFNTVLV